MSENDDRCPKCGVAIYTYGRPGSYETVVAEHVVGGMECDLIRLEAERDEARAVQAAMPKTLDGKPFIFGELYYPVTGRIGRALSNWRPTVLVKLSDGYYAYEPKHFGYYLHEVCSTREAADDAAKETNHDASTGTDDER